MATASLSTKKLPLPVELFYGAMERQLPLADYARNIDLHPDILRQALTGRLNGADSPPLSELAKAIKRDPEQLDLTTLPYGESFGMWLKRNMEGVTQHSLRKRAHLDGPTLKRFLNGDLLPDSDQAERISRALYIDRMEIAPLSPRTWQHRPQWRAKNRLNHKTRVANRSYLSGSHLLLLPANWL